MARYRNIQTGVRSEAELARALTQMGLKHIEVHADAQPLHDWIGRPTDVLANVIVRRKELGASSDDLGFVRNANGTFDLLASDIHLFKFDRKWLAELARITNTTSVAAGPVQYAAANISYANPAHSRNPPPIPAREQNVEQRTHIEVSDLLNKAKRSQSLGKLGCGLYFVPVLLWGLVEQFEATSTGVTGLVVLMILWSVVYVITAAIVVTARLSRVARGFQKRFPGREARAAAIAQLKSIAQDKQNATAEAAKKFLAAVERESTSAITQLPKSLHRGPDGKAE